MIEALIRRARQRYIGNELLAQAAYAASAAMAGVIALLIAGTQILDWRWLLGISGATLAVGVYRMRRRIPPAYVLAQLIDRRLYLADALSTALFFAAPSAKASEPMRSGQRAQAQRIAGTVDLERAIPFSMPRSVYSLAALGLVASGLFALRYGMSRRLDLGAPLARIVMQNLGIGAERQEAALRKTADRRADAPKPVGITLPEADPNNSAQLDSAPDAALDTVGVPEAVNDPLRQDQANSKAKSESAATEKAEGEQGDSDSSEASDATSGESVSDAPQGAKKGSQDGAANSGTPGNAEQNPSLVSKLRDAVSNLLSKMHNQNGSGSQRQSNSGQPAQQAGAQRGQKQNGASGEGKQQGSGQETADSESQQTGAEGKDGQSAQAKGGGQSSNQQAAKQPGSGIGRQDGNKDTKLAEQLAAMGKISEIIGKRSATVTGEITVEVPSSQQQLRTPYSQSSATHGDTGGEVSRDEVPVIFQQYVQQYFEQVRKQPARKTETTTRSKAQTPASKTPPSM
ncbi:MAG TPA: hypothetical protein VLX58_17710 [Bryobacteraceae bacterium]|nr:hypothetical protein [Bryobacteraceae bacterium]